MIPFFRRIRKKMADDNRPLKYMRYAIGEIVLVVIGILIALSINNWNEDRKTKSLEHQFLNRLKSDLVIDTIYFGKRILQSTEVVLSHHQFIVELFKGQTNVKEVMELFELIKPNSEFLTIQNSTYFELTSSGKLDVISKNTLKEDLIKYYRDIDQAEKHIEEFNNFSVALLLQFFQIAPISSRILATDIDLQNFYNNQNFSFQGEWNFINDPQSTKFQSLEQVVIAYKNKHNKFLNYFINLKSQSKVLINNIEKEIEN